MFSGLTETSLSVVEEYDGNDSRRVPRADGPELSERTDQNFPWRG
jgi:hypothetical protein